MHSLTGIEHDKPIQYHGNYIEVKKCNHMLEIDIFRNSSQWNVGVLIILMGEFWGFGCQNDAQTPCWLRLQGQSIYIKTSLDYAVWAEYRIKTCFRSILVARRSFLLIDFKGTCHLYWCLPAAAEDLHLMHWNHSRLYRIVLPSRVSMRYLVSQTLKNHPLGYPNRFMSNFLKCQFKAFDWSFSINM